MIHDNTRDALEYAATLLEQRDEGGTLPDQLRQIANTYDDLLAACEKLIEAHADDENADFDMIIEAEVMANAAITAARGKK